ncbi:MAG: 4Fe-4S binding protein [Asgard group archaeon]|nr:4Fe-4S binding protein [Asgard group archaeon]
MQSENNSTNPYKQLSRTLNQIPNGFPITDDGTHLRVLEWIFTPDEAELASKLKLRGERIKRIAKRVNIPEKELSTKLEKMEKKGQIRSSKTKRGKKYGLLPFVVGIYEEQLPRLTKEFSELMEEYFKKTKGRIVFSYKPAVHRVIPVDKVIETNLRVHPYNQARKIIEKAKSWGVRECICRKQQKLLGNLCSYPLEVCLALSYEKNAFKNKEATKAISKQEAIKILRKAETAGLIHSTMNIASGHFYICNCCTCCCGVFKALTKYKQPNAFVKADYVLSINEELCIGCGKCLEKCQFNALQIIEGKCQVNDRCVGCGVCALVCPESALSLIPRDETEKPSKNIVFWMLKRALKRGLNILKII